MLINSLQGLKYPHAWWVCAAIQQCNNTVAIKDKHIYLK